MNNSGLAVLYLGHTKQL